MHRPGNAARWSSLLVCVMIAPGPAAAWPPALAAAPARAAALAAAAAPTPEAPPDPDSPPHRGLVITEILAAVPTGPEGDANQDGVRHVSGDEFIELYNHSSGPVNLRGYRLTDRDAGKAAGIDFRFPQLVVQPRQVVVVFNGNGSNIPGPVGDSQRPPSATNERFSGAWVFSIRAASQRMSLANAADRVTLYDPDGRVVQDVSWGPSDGAARSLAPVVDGVSVTRLAPSGPFIPHPRAAGLFSPGLFAHDATGAAPPVPAVPAQIPAPLFPRTPPFAPPSAPPVTPPRGDPPQAPADIIPRIPPLSPAPEPVFPLRTPRPPTPTTPTTPPAPTPDGEPLPAGVAAKVSVRNLTERPLLVEWVVLWSVGDASAAHAQTQPLAPGESVAHDFPTGGPRPLLLVRVSTENLAEPLSVYRVVHAGERVFLKVSMNEGLLVVDR
ncbi:MAG: hypothetical protein C0513_02385 [Isosphaera sp.]|nr:hypothetical protein [Isosphaera sp.]